MMQGNGAGSGSKAGESAEASWHGGLEYARSGASKREKDWHDAGSACTLSASSALQSSLPLFVGCPAVVHSRVWSFLGTNSPVP